MRDWLIGYIDAKVLLFFWDLLEKQLRNTILIMLMYAKAQLVSKVCQCHWVHTEQVLGERKKAWVINTKKHISRMCW